MAGESPQQTGIASNGSRTLKQTAKHLDNNIKLKRGDKNVICEGVKHLLAEI